MKLHELFPEISLNPASAKDIKQWILQLAVEGKLTKKWREERDFSKENWVEKKLSEIANINGGYAFKSEKYTESGVRVIRISDFDENGFKNEKIVRHPYDSAFEAYRLKQLNIIMAMTGGTVGKALLVQEIHEDMFVNQRVANIQITDSSLPNFIFSVLKTKDVQDVIENAKNSTNDNISMNDIKCFKIPIPPLEEQHAIVSIVESLFKEVDELAAQAKQRIELKRSYASVALKQLCEADTAAEWQQILSVFPEIFNDKATNKTLRETILQLAVQGKLSAKWRLSSLEGGLKEGDQKNIMGGEISSLEGFAAAKKEGDPRNHQTAHELLTQIKAEKAQLIKEKKIKAEKPLPPIEVDEIPFELPEGWVWCRLGEVTDIQRGSSPRPKGDPLYFSSTRTEYHWISIKDITKNSVNNILLDTEEFLTSEGTNYSRFISAGEIIVAVSGSTTGKSCISGIDGFIYDGLAVLKQINKGINHFFMALFMNQKYNQMNNSKFGAAFPNINTNLLNEMIMALPSSTEQQIIVEKVNALMGLCDELEKAVEEKNEVLSKLVFS